MINSILIINDEAAAGDDLWRLLRDDPALRVDAASGREEALRMLAGGDYGVALTALGGPGSDGDAFLDEMRRRDPSVAVVVVNGNGESGGPSYRGAYDFLALPVDPGRLRLVVGRLRERALRDELARLRGEAQAARPFPDALSKNPRMQAILELVNNIAYTNATVLIEGEPGAGKEQTARAIHAASRSRTGPLVTVHCAALPESLLESELFGHEPGAFGGAFGRRRGRLETAHGGTLFLDEVGDLPRPTQAKLLRVLQERRFERVGGDDALEVDVRVVAAAARNLKRLAAQGSFREDLYRRLSVVKIELPPLRERQRTCRSWPSISSTDARGPARRRGRSRRGRWKHCSSTAGPATCASWRTPLSGPASPRATGSSRRTTCRRRSWRRRPRGPFHVEIDRPLPEVLRDAVNRIERQYLDKALRKARGNVSRCARICGMSRRSITGKIAEYKMDKSVFK